MHVLRIVAFSLVLLCLGLPVEAQPTEFVSASDTLSSSTDSFVVAVRGMASARFQTLDSYSGTWEVQCSTDGGVTYDTDDEVNLSLEGAAAAAAQSVTDTVGIWTASIAGCSHIKVIATSGFAASDTTVAVAAVATGGSSGGAVTVSGEVTVTDVATATNQGTAQTTLSSILTELQTAAAMDVAHDIPDTGNPVKIGGRADSTTPADVSADGDRVNAWFNLAGSQANFLTAHTVGGCTPGSSISGAAVLETEIKATAGTLYELVITNIDATPVYARLYNDTAANTDETDTPVARYGVPGTTAVGGIVTNSIAVGKNFSTAITIRVTTGIADNDTGALSANEVLVSYCYK